MAPLGLLTQKIAYRTEYVILKKIVKIVLAVVVSTGECLLFALTVLGMALLCYQMWYYPKDLYHFCNIRC